MLENVSTPQMTTQGPPDILCLRKKQKNKLS